MSIHVSSGDGGPRRVVLSCDLPGCSVQLEPPAAEGWRSDSDARTWARDRAAGWTCDPANQTDYCPQHARSSVAPAAGAIAPRPTAAARDPAGNPLDRDDYASRLRTRLTGDGRSTAHPPAPTAAQAVVMARLLDELAAVYRDERLGALAKDLSTLLDRQFPGPD